MRKSKKQEVSNDFGEMGTVHTTAVSGGETAAHSSSTKDESSYVDQQADPVISPPLSLNNPELEQAVEDDDEAALDRIAPPAMTRKMRRLMDMAIVTELVGGTPVEIIAKNYKLDVRYVIRVRAEWMKACKLQETVDYKHELKALSLEAIRDGLKKGDVHKRMNGGIKVMTGIGEFKPDVININVLQRLENVPPELRDRFITSTEADEVINVEAQEVEEVNG